ncbi:MAG: AN1-type zinc finger domain-containing protein [Candidatus Hodarchaeota archaeon]
MNILTELEQITLVIGVILTSFLVTTVIIIPVEINIKILLVGGIAAIISLLVTYFFIIQPMNIQSKTSSSYDQYSVSRSQNFHPTIIPPSKQVKKTVMKGTCQFCGDSTLMGFTCSYCNGYYCPEHRLPEKHDCLGLV